MSQAEDLLNELSAENEEHTYAVDADSEPHIIIGPDRVITVPDSLKRIAVQYDHDVETVTFDCPRYSDGRDLSEMKIYINGFRADKEPFCWPVDNGVTVDESDDSIIHFDWTITRELSEVHGNIVFLVCAKKTDEDGNEDNHWNSELCKDMYISEGLEVMETIINKYPDLVTHLLTRMDIVENKTTLESMLGYLDLYFTTDAKINDVLMHYVEDYLQTDDDVTRQITDVINVYISEHLETTDPTLTIEGGIADAAPTGDAVRNTVNRSNDIFINDSIEGVLSFKKLYGKSKQKTIPGNQLLDITKQSITESDTIRIIAYNEDGSTTITNTSVTSAITGYSHLLTGTIPAGVYTLNVIGEEVYLQTVSGDYSNLVKGKHVFTYDGNSYLRLIGANIPENSSKTYKFMLNVGETALEWEPYCGGIPSPNPEYPQEIKSAGGSGSVDGAIYGRNLLDMDEVYSKLGTNNEIAQSYINGKLTMTGTPTAAYRQNTTGRTGLALPKYVTGRKLYFGATLSGDQPYIVLYLRDASGAQLEGGCGLTASGVKEVNIPKNAAYMEFAFCLNMGTTGSAYTATYNDLYLSPTNDGYKPHVELKELTVPTPNGLPGIEVTDTSLANYTDADGKMWYCDEIDFERGVYVQRIEKIVLNGSEIWTKSSDDAEFYVYHYALSNAVGNQNFGVSDRLLYDIQQLSASTKNSSTDVGFAVSAAYNVLYMNIGYYLTENTVEAVKAYLATNPITVHYILATPIETALTNEQIKAVNSLAAYDGATNILLDEVAPGVEVEYPRTLAAAYILENRQDIGIINRRYIKITPEYDENKTHVDIIKEYWPHLEDETVYIADVLHSNWKTAIIQKTNDLYGSFILYGYLSYNPVYAYQLNGVWTVNELAALGVTNAYFQSIVLGSTPDTGACLYNGGNDDIWFKYKAGDETVEYVNVEYLHKGLLPLTGGTLTGSLQVPSVGTNGYLPYIVDGWRDSRDANETGYLKIKLPHTWNDTMLKFTVSIYNYKDHTSVDYTVGGYLYYGGSTWYQISAVATGHIAYNYANLPVRFGHDRDTCCVYIGNADTEWNHPVVQIKDVLIGFAEYEYDTWNDGWGISIISTLDNTGTEQLVQNPNPIASAITASGDTLIYNWL